MKDYSDEELSRFLEGLAEGEADTIERARASDPAFAARLARLARVLPERVKLPPLAPPADLRARTLARLADEALYVPPAKTPGDLLARTLGRLEAEGLKKPAPTRASTSEREERPAPIAFPARPAGWAFVRAAAVLFVTLGAGLFAGYSLRGSVPVERIAYVDRVVEKIVPRDVEKIVEKRVEVVKEVPVEVVKYVDREVVKVVEKEVPRDVVREVPVEKVVIKEVRVSEPVAVALADLAGVERWDAARASWQPLAGAATLAPGTLLRGTGAATLKTNGKTQHLSERAYVLTGAGAVEPVPDALVALGRASAPVAVASAAPAVEIPRLLELREGGLPEERARAQQALEGHWRALGGPGPGAVASLAQVLGGRSDPRPPASAREWDEWWGWARSRVER